MAYEVLSHPEKRAVYDKYGEEGEPQPRGFGDLFGGFGRTAETRNAKRKVQPTVHRLKCSLEDIYNGKTTQIEITRDRYEAMDGVAPQPCSACDGSGAITAMAQIGPGMYTQSTVLCDDCKGMGVSAGTARKDVKALEVTVDKGAPQGEQYTFHGEGDEFPGAETGDVIVVVEIEEHQEFKRLGADLLYQKTVSLVEALTGIDFVFTNLDGRKVRVMSTPNEVIHPNSLMTLKEMGLPFHKRSFEHGNIFVSFNVEFPSNLDAEQMRSLINVLHRPEHPHEESDMEVTLEEYQESHRNIHHQGGIEGNDSEGDEDHEGMDGGHRMECANQ